MTQKSPVGSARPSRSPRLPASRAAAALAIALAAAIALLAASCAAGSGFASARAGRLSWRPGAGPVALAGEWDSAPLGTPSADFDAVAKRVEIGGRSSLFRSGTADSAPGRAYRVRLVLEAGGPPRDYALLLAPADGIASLSVDGRTLFAGPARGTVELRFASAEAAVEILVNTEPGPNPFAGGSMAPGLFLLGSPAEISAFRLLAAGLAIFDVGYFLFAGVFMFILFLFWRKNLDFLAFSLFSVAAAWFYLVKFSAFMPVPTLSGDFHYHLALQLQYAGLAFFLATALGRLPLPAVLGPVGAILLLGLAPLAFPGASRQIGVAALAFDGLTVLAALGLALRRSFRGGALRSGDRRSRRLALLLLVPLLSIAARQALPGSLAAALLVEPAGTALFAFLAMLLLVRKIGDTFEDAEVLNDYVSTVAASMRRFIPREFLEALDKPDIVDLRLGDHVKKEMTIFFSDIRAFTELSEGLTVEENFAFINSYLSRVVPIVTEHGGFIDKYIGDAIMALFSGPKGADHAIRAAIEMQSRILEYNGHRAKMGYRAIQMGVGIHTGALMLGVVGVTDRMENTVISDAVNLASRLQAITKAFNIPLAISEQSFKELDDPGEYKYRFIGKVKVKGKAAPVSVFEIFDGLAPELFERKMKANMFFEQGMLSYYQKDFAGAMYYFRRVLDAIPQDGAAAFYLETCINKAAR